MFFLAFMLCLPGQVPGSLRYDPRLSWYTLETPNFAVHFSSRGQLNPEAESLALQVARLAEEVHEQLTASIGWTPRPRTQIVIADFFDYTNGWAAPLPENTITILPYPPLGHRVNYTDWLRTLLVHEYAHILQMDMVAGLPAVARSIFGRSGLTNPLSPVWLLEGYAILAETRFAGFGRAHSAEYDMMIRAAADADALLPIDRCCHYELARWPQGTSPYLYGGLFARYLGEKFGNDIWDRYSLYRARGLPFFDNFFARRVFGRSFFSWWSEWQKEIRAHASSIKQRIENESLTPLYLLTNEGGYTSSPIWSADGTEVYYVSRNGNEYPAIKAVNLATGSCRVLHRGRVTGNLSLSPDGTLLAFAQYELTNYSDISDLYTLNLVTGELKRLTWGMRARDPDFSPDSTHLAFVAVRHGQTDIILYHLASGEKKNLTETTDYTVFSSPRFSPDGHHLAVCASRLGGYTDIQIIDLVSGWNSLVLEDRAQDLSPFWSRTATHLFFISDRSGVFNLYAYSPQTHEILRCTNVPYGVFSPAVSPDNRRLVLVTHTAGGDNIALLNVDARTWKPVTAFADTAANLPDWPDGLAVSSSQKPANLYYYNPFPSLWPKFWVPFAVYDSTWTLAVFTLGWDALQFHRYAATAGYRFNRTPFLLCGYELRRYQPLPAFFLEADRQIQAGTFSLTLPFLTNRRSSQLEFATAVRHDTTFSARYRLDFATSNAFAYRFDLAPAEGTLAGLATDLESRHMLGGRDRIRALFWLNGFIRPLSVSRLSSPALPAPVPVNWSLRLRCAAGTSLGDSSQLVSWSIYPDASPLGVRGFTTASAPGRNIASASIQLRMPLCWPERGISTAPIFLRNINTALFADWALVWNRWKPGKTDLADARLGAGIELRTDLILAHLLPANVTVGYARGLRPTSSNQLYLTANSSMLNALIFRKPERLDPWYMR